MNTKVLKNIYILSVLVSLTLIMSSIALVDKVAKKAEAATESGIIPFAGQISYVSLCCNGIEFSTTGQYQSVAYGTFIMQWPMMFPDPDLGMGLYSWWSILPTEKVIGNVTTGGQCLTVASECETTTPVTYSVLQMGTTLLTI